MRIEFLMFCSLFAFPLFSLNYVVNLGTDTSINSGGASTGPTSGDLRYVLN